MEIQAVLIISSIWTVFSGFFIYHFAFYSSNTYLYIFLCWVSIAPLAGAIIYNSLSDMRKEKASHFEIIGALFGLGILVGLVVSAVDYFLFSNPFLDFICDLIEIGFGFFAITSYYFYKLLVVRLMGDDKYPNIGSMKVRQNANSDFDAQLEKLQDVKQKRNIGSLNISQSTNSDFDAQLEKLQDVKQKRDKEKKYNEILEKMKNHSLKGGMDSLSEYEKNLFRECVFDKVKKYGLKNKNISQIEALYYLGEMRKIREQQNAPKSKKEKKALKKQWVRKVAERDVEEKKAQEFEKKLKNLKKEFIENINNTLSQSSYGDYVIIGEGDQYASRYGLNDYPVKSLKWETEKYIEKLAKMTKEQLKEEEQRVYVAEQKRKAWEAGYEERAERAMRLM